MAERTADFAKRLGGDVKSFVRDKSREVSDKLEESINDFFDAVEEVTYENSLEKVAKHFDLKSNEVERILLAHTRKSTK